MRRHNWGPGDNPACLACGVHAQDQLASECPGQDRRIALILAFTEAGLLDKAEKLKKEMLAEHLGHQPKEFGDIKADLAKMETRLEELADKVADKIGAPRRKRRPK